MRPAPRIFLLLLTGACTGVGLRWWRAGSLSGNPEPTKATLARPSPATVAAPEFHVKPVALPAPLSAAEILLLRGSAQVEALAVWLAQASTADVAAMAAEWTKTRDDTLIGRMLFLRWAELDAAGMMAVERSADSWEAWARVHPEDALAAALKEKRPDAGRVVLKALGESDPGRAASLLAQYPQFKDTGSLEALAAGLSARDLRAGAEVSLRTTFAGNLRAVKTWAAAEPDAALAWARQIKSPAQRINMLQAVIGELAVTDPDRASAAIRNLPSGQLKTGMIVSHAGSLALTDPDAAVAWANAVTVPYLRDAALGQAAKALAVSDPARAEEILRGIGTQEAFQVQAGSALAVMARADPQRAMSIAQDLTGNTDHVTAPVFYAWMADDANAASAWLAGIPPDRRSPGMVDILVNTLTMSPAPDYAAAIQWVLSKQGDASIRHAQASEMARQWIAREPNALPEIQAIPSLPPEVRHAVETWDRSQAEPPSP